MQRLNNIQSHAIRPLFSRYCLQLQEVAAHEDIPHSFWGAPEAGRRQTILYAREDTPVHSLLHEACHYICQPPTQRAGTQIDAGGSAAEENACCYLQLLLSEYIPGYSLNLQLHDMNAWGYNFRLGTSARWFYADSQDAQDWLLHHDIIDSANQPTWRIRTQT